MSRPESIAQLIYDQMMRAGKPRTTTQTTELQQPGGLDLGSLGMLLYLMLSQDKSQPQISDFSKFYLGTAPPITPSYTPSLSAGQQNPMNLLLSILGSAGKAGGGF